MNPSQRDCGVGPDQNGPSIEPQQRAFTVVAEHPHFVEASRYTYCEPIVLLEPKSFVNRMKLDVETKNTVLHALGSCDQVLLIEYMTSTKQPEPLTGGGKTFDFILHPETLEIIHTTTGKWIA